MGEVCSKNVAGTEVGFCGVLHFSKDGGAVHVTVGCGASGMVKGVPTPLAGAKLDRRTKWARGVLEEAHGSVEPFVDSADFGATKKFGRRRQLPPMARGVLDPLGRWWSATKSAGKLGA